MKVDSNDLGLDEETSIVAEINITPLTDIFLVLLIIFMVTSSVMSQVGMDVNLPQAGSDLSQAQPEGVILTLLPDGRMKVAERELRPGDWSGLESTLKRAFELTSSRLVVIEGDREAMLGNAVQAMDHARLAGAQTFALAAESTGSK